MANCACDEPELAMLLRCPEKRSQALWGRNPTRPFPISTGPGLRCANGASAPWKLLLPGVAFISALAGKGEAPLSLPFVAAESIPRIYRGAPFSQRATPMELPCERNTHRHVSGGGKKSRNEISPIRRKCLFFSL
jgi:hypothetical protein